MTITQKIKILHNAADRIAIGLNAYSCDAIYDSAEACNPEVRLLVKDYADFYDNSYDRAWLDLGIRFKMTEETQSLRTLLLLNYAEALKYE